MATLEACPLHALDDAQDTMTDHLANMRPSAFPVAMGLGDGLGMFADSSIRGLCGGGAFVVLLFFSRAHMVVLENPAELRPQGQLVLIRLGMVSSLAGVAASFWL